MAEFCQVIRFQSVEERSHLKSATDHVECRRSYCWDLNRVAVTGRLGPPTELSGNLGARGLDPIHSISRR